MNWINDSFEIERIVLDLRRVAARFHAHTGQTLGITNELGGLEAARCLGLRLIEGAGYDAVDGQGARVCIRSRVVQSATDIGPVCINGLRFDVPWDALIIVLLDDQFEVLAMFRARRGDLEQAMRQSHFRKPSHRPAFAINTIVRCATKVWPLLQSDVVWTGKTFGNRS